MKAQHLIGLRVENFKRLSAVRIAVDPANPNGVLVLAGDNGAGKSSVLDAISAALMGERYAPEQPVRIGADKSKIILQTEDLVVRRTFTPSGSTLVVKDADGVPQSTPQKLLDKLCNAVGFDPLSFARMDEKKQADVLLKMFPLDIDLDANSQLQKESYERRRDLNRDAKTVAAQLAAIPEFGRDVPDVEESLSRLLEEMSIAREKKQAIEQIRTEIAARNDAISKRAEVIKSRHEQIEQIRQEITRLDEEQKASSKRVETLEAKSQDTIELDASIAELDKKIAGAETLNKKVRAKQNRAKGVLRLQDLEAKAETEGATLADLARQREQALAAVKYPVEGMSITDGAVTINGVPFSQASTAEQIRVGIALAAAANPQLKLAFVRDGSLLDARSMAEIAKIAEQHGMQVLIERVDDKSPTAIQIVDGSTAGAEVIDEPEEQVAPAPRSKSAKKPVPVNTGIEFSF